MSRREAVYVSKRVSCDGGKEPNAFYPAITVEVRIFFPPLVSQGQLSGVVDDAIGEAIEKLNRWRQENAQWLTL